MTRDYKPRAAEPRRHAARPWRWLLAGLLLGAGVAAGVFYALNRAPEGPRAQWVEPEAVVAEAAEAQPAAEDKPPEAAPTVPPPRFDFYQMLTEETAVPEREIRGPVKQGVAQVEAPGTYVLQAGSFRTAAQADQQRARLALIGITARVEAVRLGSGEVVQRVQIGPYRDLADLNRIRARLKQNGFAVLLLKVKG